MTRFDANTELGKNFNMPSTKILETGLVVLMEFKSKHVPEENHESLSRSIAIFLVEVAN
jgi:hypothetical protein